jgi:hypothetical protein
MRGVLATAACALALASAGWPAAPARALEGRYLASMVHTEGAESDDILRQRYDMGTQSVTPGNLSLDLRMSLSHQVRPGESNTGLLGSRFFGDLRSPAWRLRGQIVPWQDLNPGANSPRERNLQAGLDLMPRGAPRLSLDYQRLDRDVQNQRSFSEDRRAQLAYETGGVSANLRYRNLGTRSPESRTPGAQTREWRGFVSGTRSYKRLSGQASYDGLLSRFRSGDRARDLTTQQVDLSGTWSPSRKLTLGATALDRWGQVQDNIQNGDRAIAARALSARADYTPVTPIQLQAAREYRREAAPTGDVVSDYLRLQGIFRRPLLRAMTFQTGYEQTVNLQSGGGSVPSSTGFALLDGHVRTGVEGHGEVRAAHTPGGGAPGIQWMRLLQLRTYPSRSSRLEASYRLETLPVDSLTQRDRQWDFTAGYDPSANISLVGSYRMQDGTGRVDRSERNASASTTWRAARRTSMGVNWSHRRARAALAQTRETVTGVDVTFWLPGEWKLHGSANYVTSDYRQDMTSYNVILEKVF